jgi:hypothetical protein
MIRLSFLIIALAVQVGWSVQAHAEALSFERYYIKKYSCAEASDIHECQKQPTEFHEIGIIRRGARVCGIAHYSSFRKTDVTRFVGTISGNLAQIEFSSSHDQEKVATGTIVLTPKSAKWMPKIVGWSGGGGYHSSPFVAHRTQMPGKRETYLTDAKGECDIYLSNGTPLEKLGWDF